MVDLQNPRVINSQEAFELHAIDPAQKDYFVPWVKRNQPMMVVPPECVGMVADDRSAVVGHANWCFIYEGSNNYRSAYIDKAPDKLGSHWAHLIEKRSQALAKEGIQFVQVIIPNKLSLLSEFFPEPLKTDASFLLQDLMACQTNAPLLLPLEAWRHDDVRDIVFRRNDSHLSMIGSIALLRLIFQMLGLVIPGNMVVYSRYLHQVGDLGGKFDPPLAEQLAMPLWEHGVLANLGQYQVVDDKNPSGFLGIRQVFVNPQAPIKQRVVVFGNSFFERAPSWGLSPYFVALFTEFHFIWRPEVDIGYCREVGADVVIAQTCERFLTELPVDVGV